MLLWLMDSKIDESTGESSAENALSSSLNGIAGTDKSRIYETGQYGSVDSCDSFSEHAKWKPICRISDGSAASGDEVLLQKANCSKESVGLDHASATDLGLMENSLPRNMIDADHLMKDGNCILQVPESNDLEEGSCNRVEEGNLGSREEDSELQVARRVQYDKLMNSREINEDVDKHVKSSDLPYEKDNPSESHLMGESDDSDFVEQDVKVCDICGDAGREDLLAICCKCSDGAEHTYCMREMREKVPEGDWMCEECQYDEELRNHRQGKIAKVDGSDEKNPSRKASGGNPNNCLKLQAKSAYDADITSKNHSNMKILGKRHKDDAEVSSLAKKQAVEPVLGSPKKTSPSIVGPLSPENSLKHLDKGKEKLVHQSSSGAPEANDDIKSARCPVTSPRMLTPRGTFLKSNSFSSLNAKPKVKLVDEVISLKQKSTREPSALDLKEGTAKSFGKSMSFKTLSSGRMGTGESKVKMISPNFSNNQDNKGFKHSKERGHFERKCSFKSERPSVKSPRVGSSVLSTKSDNKVASRGETVVSSVSNNRQARAIQSDSKSASLSKSSGLASRRASDVPVFSGEAKRQSLEANELGGCEQKPASKDDPMILHIAEGPANDNSNESLSDESSWRKESLNVGERLGDFVSQPKQYIGIGGRIDICQKCKEVGHLTQCCPVHGLSHDFSGTKSVRDVTNSSDDLKAAIEAARLRKPGICRKTRVAEQSNDLSQASKNGELVSEDPFSSSIGLSNVSSGEANQVLSTVHNSIDSCKQAAVGNVKASTSRTGVGVLVVPYDGITPIRDLPCHIFSELSMLWRILAIPEHEYSWQGNFEVHKNCKVEYCDGIQAHLSTYASPRVLGAVKNFSYNVVLNEVPRLSTWPIQFQEYGVKEKNVALYFFAKDVDSYEKSYKILLENMIKNDLALQGIIDGVELLIFPSTHLPEQSQRWNLLFFLWGVFRGKKKSLSHQMSGFPEQYLMREDNPPATMPGNLCSLQPGEKDLSSDASLVAEGTSTNDKIIVSSEPSLVQVEDTEKIILEKPGCKLGSNSVAPPRSSMKSCQEIRCTINSLEGGRVSKCKLEAGEVQMFIQASGRNISSLSKSMLGQYDDTMRASCGLVSSQGIAEGVASLNKWSRDAGQVNSGMIIGDIADTEDAPLRRDLVTRGKITKDLDSRQSKDWNQKGSHVDGIIISEATSASGSQTIQIDDGDEDEDVGVLDISKRQKIDYDGLYGSHDQSSSSFDGFRMRICGTSGSPINASDEICEKTASTKSGNAERYFFPVDLNGIKDTGTADNSMPCKMHPLEDQHLIGTPNLELALGAETRLSGQGIPSSLVDKSVDCCPEKQANGEEDDASGSLSLSLSFPFSDEEQTMTSISKTEQRRTERRHVNTSLLLFGGIRDK